MADGHEMIDLRGVLLLQFIHAQVVLVLVDVGGVEDAVLLVEANSMVLVSRPDLVNVVLSGFGKLLPSSGRATKDNITALLLARGDNVLAVLTHA